MALAGMQESLAEHLRGGDVTTMPQGIGIGREDVEMGVGRKEITLGL